MISIVIPVYNEENNIETIAQQFSNIFEHENYELIFVNDGSNDNTWGTLDRVAERFKNVKALCFSRNFGHQNALFAGVEHSTGEVIVMMDGDLQHPPKLVPSLINKIREGYDIVNAIRDDEKDINIGWFKKSTSKMFYNIINRVADISISAGGADFRAITREVADKFLEMKESNRFNRGLFAWLGFKQFDILFVPDKRLSGTSKYSIRKMIIFASDGLTSFSVFPLRIFFASGMVLILFGILYLGFTLYQFLMGTTISGWPSIVALLVIILGSNLFGLGLIGEYVGRIFIEVKRRPLYLISKKLGFE